MTYSANYNNKNALQTLNLQGIDFMIGDPAGTRTQGPNIKSVVLYQLSYEINFYTLTSVLKTECKNKPSLPTLQIVFARCEHISCKKLHRLPCLVYICTF